LLLYNILKKKQNLKNLKAIKLKLVFTATFFALIFQVAFGVFGLVYKVVNESYFFGVN